MYLIKLHSTITAYRVSKMMMMNMCELSHVFNSCKNKEIFRMRKFILPPWHQVPIYYCLRGNRIPCIYDHAEIKTTLILILAILKTCFPKTAKFASPQK